MPLAAQAAVAVPVVPGAAGYTCHVATWFWAAQEAQAQGLIAVKPAATTLANIAGMALNAQHAILALATSGNWDFAVVPTTPPVGTVLLWRAATTHSAVVSAPNTISGYNQVGWFPVLGVPGGPGAGHTSPPLMSLAGHLRQVELIAEATIVAQAAALNL